MMPSVGHVTMEQGVEHALGATGRTVETEKEFRRAVNGPSLRRWIVEIIYHSHADNDRRDGHEKRYAF